MQFVSDSKLDASLSSNDVQGTVSDVLNISKSIISTAWTFKFQCELSDQYIAS